MELPLHNASGASSTITVSDRLFATPANADLIFQIATSQMSNKRQVVAHTKTRSEVAGGGKKPWRQKGTGRARHGSIRSPIWVGGGVAHGPTKDVNFKKTITKAAARRALAGVLSARVAEGHLAVVDQFAVTSGKTKDAITQMRDTVKAFAGYRAGQRVLLVLAGSTDEVATRRAVANLPYVQAVRASDLNALTVLSFPYVVATAGAIEAAQKTFSK